MGFAVIGLDHVQLAMPPGRESEAEAFYAGFLGFVRIPKYGATPTSRQPGRKALEWLARYTEPRCVMVFLDPFGAR